MAMDVDMGGEEGLEKELQLTPKGAECLVWGGLLRQCLKAWHDSDMEFSLPTLRHECLGGEEFDSMMEEAMGRVIQEAERGVMIARRKMIIKVVASFDQINEMIQEEKERYTGEVLMK